MRPIKIADRWIGRGRRCFIIAEAGVNHNQDIGLAKKLIAAAKDAGADAVKFQTFKANKVVAAGLPMAAYQRKNLGVNTSQQEMLKGLELQYEDFRELKKYADLKGIIFLSTPYAKEDIDFLEDLVPAYKVSSCDLNNFPFLEKIAKKRKPVILATGMATLKEVREALSLIYKHHNNKIVVLHCTTNYPCPLEEVNIKAMATLRDKLHCLVGYSDHTCGIIVPVIAVTSGAVVIEKHLTLNKNFPGPDHKASLEPEEFKEMVEAVRDAEKAFGDGLKGPARSEVKNKKVMRKSIVAKIDIPKGAKITADILEIKRPGTGIEPRYWDRVIGRKTKRGLKRDTLIKFEDLR